MKLEKIITLANAVVKPQFMAMERSLRATGCDLPLWVIPYDENLFELPPNAHWWREPALLSWIESQHLFKMCNKYQCFLTDNYQYVDSDIIFFRNPLEVLAPVQGFISSCTHWNNPDHTYNPQSKAYFQSKSTTWQKDIFNAGQFACDRVLYSLDSLIATCEGDFRDTLIRDINLYKDQVAINLLVGLSGVPVVNLTLPPYNMQSTWAGDYREKGFEAAYWSNPQTAPYLAHWAGIAIYDELAINEYFYQHLSEREKKTWEAQVEQAFLDSKKLSLEQAKNKLRRVKKALQSI
ncbi:MAG: hypothetical protein AAFR61_03725 [Bacteroidota bacterium]